MKLQHYNQRRLLRAFLWKAFGAVILASFVFLLFFPPTMQRDDIASSSSSSLLPSFSFSASSYISAKGSSSSIPFTLSSPSFANGEEMRPLFARTNTNDDVSPPLKWSNVPDGTASLVLIMDDPDAQPNPEEAPFPTSRTTTTPAPWVHWVLYNIPPTTSKLAANVGLSTSRKLPPGTMQGLNDWNEIGYGGPSPPNGMTHRYFFKLYALDIVLPDKYTSLVAPTKSNVLRAMHGHVLCQAELMGTYNAQQPNGEVLTDNTWNNDETK